MQTDGENQEKEKSDDVRGCTIMKKPNGHGSVQKMNGNRKKPFRASITLGFDEKTGKQIRTTLGSYWPVEEAEKALERFRNKKDININEDGKYEELIEVFFDSCVSELEILKDFLLHDIKEAIEEEATKSESDIASFLKFFKQEIPEVYKKLWKEFQKQKGE